MGDPIEFGPIPNFPSNPNADFSASHIGGTVTLTTLAVLTTLARLFVRSKNIKSLGWDDCLMALAALVVSSNQSLPYCYLLTTFSPYLLKP